MGHSNWAEKTFESFLDRRWCRITDCGPLCSPILNFNFERSESLQLLLTTHSLPGSKKNTALFPDEVAGAVYQRTAEVVFTHQFSETKIVARGVQPYGTSEFPDPITGIQRKEEYANVDSIECLPDDIDTVHRQVEVVENINEFFHWPHGIQEKVESKTVKTMTGFDAPLLATDSEKGSGSKCFRFEIDGDEIILLPTSEPAGKRSRGKGLLIFRGRKSEEYRRKVRECVSYALGKPLVYLGYTLFSEDFHRLGFRAISPNTIGEAVYRLPGIPPAPVDAQTANRVDAETLSKTINAIFSCFEELDFRHVSWLYWHSECTPIHIRAGQIGAAIEALQDAYVVANEKTFETRLIEKKVARKMQAAMTEIVEAMEIGESEKELLRNKISNLNQSSQKILNERFFSHLGLTMSEKELATWQRRNDAAHGNATDVADTVNLIRDVHLLENIFHRIVLGISGASAQYIDRYTERHPIRLVSESVDAQARAHFSP